MSYSEWRYGNGSYILPPHFIATMNGQKHLERMDCLENTKWLILKQIEL